MDPNPDLKSRCCGPLGIGPSRLFKSLLASAGPLPDWRQFSTGSCVLTYQGRTAITHLCRTWGLGPGDDVLLPSYNCGAEVEPFLAEGVRPVLYRVDRGGAIDLSDLCRRVTSATRLVYVIHYFGWPQPLDEILDLCRSRKISLVEDCALALFSENESGPLGSRGDAAIFSLAKALPVPDGGVLVLRRGQASGPKIAPHAWRVARRVLSLVKHRMIAQLERVGLGRLAVRITGVRRQTHTQDQPDLVSRSRMSMPKSYFFERRRASWTPSIVTLGLLSGFDPADIVQKRRRNAERLVNSLASGRRVELFTTALPIGTCPLVLPLIVDDSRRWAIELNRRGVDAVAWWAGYHPRLPWDEFPDACFLKEHVLALPIHQDLTESHMTNMAKIVNELSTCLR